MDSSLQYRIQQFQGEGARRYSSWNAILFEEICNGPAAELWEMLQKKPQASNNPIFTGYLRLIQEAIGRGYIQRTQGGPWSNLMELILIQFVPEQLPAIKPALRLDVLATLWNLLEGLLGEPAWINQMVLARALELKHLSGLEAFLIDVLDPVLSPAPSAKWSGPFQQTILDARLIDEEFLPGEMRLAAPWVLCIQDRRRPVRLGVLLQKNGKSEFIGPLPEMEPFHDATKLPHVEPQKNAIRIGEHIVKLPRLNVPLHVEIARAGFVIVSAVDSQRLWVVESV